MQSTMIEIKSTPTLESEWRRAVVSALELRERLNLAAEFTQKHPLLLALKIEIAWPASVDSFQT